MTSIVADFAPDPRCAPPKPSLQWHKVGGNKIEPRENALEAAQYEQALKARPDAFVVQMRRDGDAGGLRVGLNPASLIHRARDSIQYTSQCKKNYHKKIAHLNRTCVQSLTFCIFAWLSS